MRFLRSPLILLAAASLLFGFTVPALGTTDEQKRVLVFNATRKGGDLASIADPIYQKTLGEGISEKLDYYTEYIDVARFAEQEYQQALVSFLRDKYRRIHFDVIITTGATCTDFLRQHGDSLFPGTPVVFVDDEKGRLPNGTGLKVELDFRQTLQTALELQPSTKRVYVVSGASAYDKFYADLARAQLQTFESRVSLNYVFGLSLSDLETTVAHLPPDSIVYFLTMAEDGAGNRYLPVEPLDKLSSVASAPIYGWVDSEMDHGIVGGSLLSLEKSSEALARVALRVIHGEDVNSIPNTNFNPNFLMFDWRQVRRWNIDEKRLPSGSLVKFKEPTLWEQYKWRIVAVISLLIIQGALIFWLLLSRVHRRRAEEAKEKLASIVQSSEDAILSTTPDGTITSWNAGAEKMFGYNSREMLGRQFSILAPDDDKEEAQRIIESVSRGESVDHLETIRKTRAGRQIEVSLSISPLRDHHGNVIGTSSIARDITDRKRGEKALQQLTGRIITLQEEERRRVAAELHDGLGQSLAIIKNRALIALRSETTDVAAQQLAEIAATATSSINEVREIAHNLRPYELDRLGLVIAIESMIERVSASSAIQFTTDLDPVDGLLSTESETGVYRIVQEGLNNLIKHSGASEARVFIKQKDGELNISVQDNGKGFSPSSSSGNNGASAGFGLAGIAERARGLGGTFVIDSDAGKGTSLNISVELS